jgi:hypothetical protein
LTQCKNTARGKDFLDKNHKTMPGPLTPYGWVPKALVLRLVQQTEKTISIHLTSFEQITPPSCQINLGMD